MNWEKLRQKVIQRDNYTCQICLKRLNKLDVHHIIPRGLKGLDSLYNLISVCEDCHSIIELRFKKHRIVSGSRMITFTIPYSLFTELKLISIEKGITLTKLYHEAIDMLFEKYEKLWK